MTGAKELGGALGDDSTVVVREGLSSCDLADSRVVLDLENGRYHGLNEVAAFLWSRLAEPIRVADLHAAVLTEYDVDPQTARVDLLNLLDALRREGLIEVRDGTAV